MNDMMNPTNESIGRAFRESITVGFDRHVDAKVWIINRARELDRQAPGEWVGVIAQAPHADVEWTEAGHNLPVGTRLYAAPQPPAQEQGVSSTIDRDSAQRFMWRVSRLCEKLAKKEDRDSLATAEALERDAAIMLAGVLDPRPRPRQRTRAAGAESRVYWKGEQITTTERLIEVIHSECSAAWGAGSATGAEDARDAERYRWLKSGGYEHADDDQPYIVQSKMDGWGKWAVLTLEDDECDAAIDAAIASQAKEGEGNG